MIPFITCSGWLNQIIIKKSCQWMYHNIQELIPNNSPADFTQWIQTHIAILGLPASATLVCFMIIKMIFLEGSYKTFHFNVQLWVLPGHDTISTKSFNWELLWKEEVTDYWIS